MDKLLAKYAAADYSPIEQVADLNTSEEAAAPGPSRSSDAVLFTVAHRSSDVPAHLASSSNIAQTPSSGGQHHYPCHSDSPLTLFRLQQGLHLHEHSARAWQHMSPEKVTAARADIDPSLLAEFAGCAYSPGLYTSNRPSSSTQGPPQSQRMANLLVECARAIAVSDSGRVKNLMWVLNEMSSPYGDWDQRLSAYVVQALFCRITGSGVSCHRILTAAAAKTYSFDTVRKMILDYQEASPWTTFGHVAGNASLMEAFEGEMKIHIVDTSNTYCTQWPTLLEALATRPDGTVPHLRLSTVVISPEETTLTVMKQIMTRLERFARLMGVPFEFSVTHQPHLEKLEIELRPDEVLAVMCNQTLHHVSEIVPTGEGCSPRDLLLCTLRNANPKIMVLVEDEIDLVSPDFVTNFCEGLRFYSLLFESIEENFPRTSNQRLMLERICARSLVNTIACDPPENAERQEKGVQWDYRLRRLGFRPCPFSDDVVDDVRALLKRYKEGWGLSINDNRLYLTWKEQVVLCATAWKPISNPSPET